MGKQTTSTVVVELPVPSEYPNGQPQWNAYPFVRIGGYGIEIGSHPDEFTINAAEARAVAAALLAAASKLDEMNHFT